jgi:hypothetical protein
MVLAFAVDSISLLIYYEMGKRNREREDNGGDVVVTSSSLQGMGDWDRNPPVSLFFATLVSHG